MSTIKKRVDVYSILTDENIDLQACEIMSRIQATGSTNKPTRAHRKIKYRLEVETLDACSCRLCSNVDASNCCLDCGGYVAKFRQEAKSVKRDERFLPECSGCKLKNYDQFGDCAHFRREHGTCRLQYARKHIREENL